jgi:hypothetical protein
LCRNYLRKALLIVSASATLWRSRFLRIFFDAWIRSILIKEDLVEKVVFAGDVTNTDILLAGKTVDTKDTEFDR